MSDIVVKVDNLSKAYRLGVINHGMLYKDIQSWWARVRGKEDPNSIIGMYDKNQLDDQDRFWALKDIDFEVRQGDRIGIVGKNGAGKSTLLKVLSRVTAPTKGSVKVSGRIASLLEVGTGFHPELTGRENVYLNGAVFGMSKQEIQRKFDEIVDFSGIEKFIDTPVKRYSSGMYVRLGFAVAAHLDPEILVVDEVLAVGDAEFQKKCLGKMEDVSKVQGRTILFVSHNIGAIKNLCNKAIWLHYGKCNGFADVSTVVNKYLSTVMTKDSIVKFNPKPLNKGYVEYIKIYNNKGNLSSEFMIGENPMVEVCYVLNERVKGFHVSAVITNTEGFFIFSTADTDLNESLFNFREKGRYIAKILLPMNNFNIGNYNLRISMGIPRVEDFDNQSINFSIQDMGSMATMKEGYGRAGLLLVETAWQYMEV